MDLGRERERLLIIVPFIQFNIFNHIEILNFHLKIGFVFVLGNCYLIISLELPSMLQCKHLISTSATSAHTDIQMHTDV